MSNIINFNITGGVPPFKVNLSGSTIPQFSLYELGEHSIYNVSEGLYTLNITDKNDCVFEKEIIVNPNITTTTTTKLPDYSIMVGHTQDPLTIFNPTVTNRDGEFTGYPDPDVVKLYLWFKTLNGEPLVDKRLLSYKITIDGDTADSKFEFNSVGDEVHTDIQEVISGPKKAIWGDIIFKGGFIETYFEYTYYRGSTNRRFEINIDSPLGVLYPNFETKTEAGTTYGITDISVNDIQLNY